MSRGHLKLSIGSTLPLQTRPPVGSPGVRNPAPKLQLLAIYLVSGLLIHVIFSKVFFPFQKYGRKLILCLEDLDHIVSNTSLKQSSLGGQTGVPVLPDSRLAGPIAAHIRGSPKGYVSDPIPGFSRKGVNWVREAPTCCYMGVFRAILETTLHAKLLS